MTLPITLEYWSFRSSFTFTILLDAIILDMYSFASFAYGWPSLPNFAVSGESTPYNRTLMVHSVSFLLTQPFSPLDNGKSGVCLMRRVSPSVILTTLPRMTLLSL